MCLFCKIANHEIPAFIIYEDNDTMAFLDVAPLSLGHTLVISKHHSNHFLNTSTLVNHHVIDTANIIGNQLLTKLSADGLNIITNVLPAAGQVVDHFHIHLIPRFDDDNLTLMPASPMKETAYLQAVYEQITK